jgi:3-hydroxyacyl-CoA dehydrogenase / enoyl-CoA hydratase / 3-hydroxybutyryl-CoA epimerase
VKADKSYPKSALLTLGRELVEPLIAEAKRARDEGVVQNADLVDAGVIFGTGFAPFRGGPLHFAASEVGEAKPKLTLVQKQAAE